MLGNETTLDDLHNDDDNGENEGHDIEYYDDNVHGVNGTLSNENKKKNNDSNSVNRDKSPQEIAEDKEKEALKRLYDEIDKDYDFLL